MAFLNRNKAKIYYRIFGTQGPVLVLINGHTRDSKDFSKLAKDISKNEKNRVLVFDNRASGLTESSLDFTLEDICDDLFKICDLEKISHINLLGISMGGVIAQIFCMKYPSFVKNLILVSTTCDPYFSLTNTNDTWPSENALIQKKLSSFF